jgi:hypothetical protein
MNPLDQIFEITQLSVINSASSIFTKDDVHKLITQLQSNINKHAIDESKLPKQPISTPNILASDFANFTSKVREKLSYYLESSDIVDYDSANFEFEYDNRIVLSHVNVDLDSWTEEFDEYMLDNFTEVFGDDSIIAEQ